MFLSCKDHSTYAPNYVGLDTVATHTSVAEVVVAQSLYYYYVTSTLPCERCHTIAVGNQGWPHFYVRPYVVM